MAHKRSSGAGRNGRDSKSKRRGIKKYAGEHVIPGNIIIRQCGTRIHPGHNVGLGNDYTIFATLEGYVKYEHIARGRRQVSVYPEKV
jgi:large subunit ribosomal protein L27